MVLRFRFPSGESPIVGAKTAARCADRMSQPDWRNRRQFGVFSYRPGALLPIYQLDSIVSCWK